MPASLLIPLAFGLCTMMLGVFLNAKKSDFLELKHNAKAVFFIAAMQFLLVPAVGFLFVYGLKNMPQYQAMSFGVWLIALCPGGIM